MRQLEPHDFAPAAYPVPLQAQEVQLWYFGDGDRAAAATRLLGLLAAYLDRPVAQIRLERGAHGKPRIAAGGAIEFNLSHTSGGSLIGISRSQALGVDVEATARTRASLELARRFFAAAEAATLARLDPAPRAQAFLELWSCKEAVLKALGQGLGFGLERVVFALDRSGRPERLNVIDASAGAAQEWQITRLLPDAGHVGAVAWRGPERMLRAFRGGG